jgi:hypothetical protein
MLLLRRGNHLRELIFYKKRFNKSWENADDTSTKTDADWFNPLKPKLV